MDWVRDHKWEKDAAMLMRKRGWPDNVPTPEAYRAGPLAALVGREPVNGDMTDIRWHISVQHENRIPSWAELVSAAHDLRPGVVFVIPVPPKSWWVNVHPRVIHLHELRDRPLIQQWRFEGRGDKPS